jgi:UDP-N-acetylmuramate dehydrogenase
MRLDAELLAYLADERQITVRPSLALSTLTTLRIGGAADFVLTPHDGGAFLRLLDCRSLSETPFRVLGCGSNILASDNGYSGAVVLTGRLDRLSISDKILRVGAGVRLSRAVNAAREAGLSGLEGLYGIPGSVGGALAMNAGAFGCEISSALSFATLYDPVARSVFVASPAELDFGYRKIAVSERRLIVVSASFVLASGDRDKIAKRMRDVVRRRAESQPLGYPSAGCVFKRSPDCRSAGALIESVGMKGRRIGDAAV